MPISDTVKGVWQTVMLGGPVLVLLVLVSVASLALFIVKLLQFRRAGVGRHTLIGPILRAHDRGDYAEVERGLAQGGGHLAELVRLAVRTPDPREAQTRLEAEAGQSFLDLERGFRFLDIVTQTAPLLGLFGTVLGMIEAFQALQGAGAQVDPGVLAGGIWVALLTTAAGLAVAMPVSIGLAWLEAKLDRDRAMAELILATLALPLAPSAKPVLAAANRDRKSA